MAAGESDWEDREELEESSRAPQTLDFRIEHTKPDCCAWLIVEVGANKTHPNGDATNPAGQRAGREDKAQEPEQYVALTANAIRPAIIRLAFVAGSVAGVLNAQSSTRDESWPEVDVYLGVNDKSRLFFQYSGTRQDELRTYADGQVGAFFEFCTLPLLRRRLREQPDASRDKLLMFRIGYAYFRSPASGDSRASISHIPTIEATSRFPLPRRMLLSDRNRGDLRVMNGAFGPRYRNRLKFERTFEVRPFLLTPYADTEVFYDWRYDKFNEVRYAGGMEWSITHFLMIDLYYTRQHTTTSSPKFVNALGGKLEFYLRNKR